MDDYSNAGIWKWLGRVAGNGNGYGPVIAYYRLRSVKADAPQHIEKALLGAARGIFERERDGLAYEAVFDISVGYWPGPISIMFGNTTRAEDTLH